LPEGEGIVAFGRLNEGLGSLPAVDSPPDEHRRDRTTQPGGAFKIERALDRVGLGPETN
jgi:hypothetical protein